MMGLAAVAGLVIEVTVPLVRISRQSSGGRGSHFCQKQCNCVKSREDSVLLMVNYHITSVKIST